MTKQTEQTKITIKYPNKLILIKMLETEESIRMSKEYVEMCDNVKDEINGWLRISEEIQYQIAKDFGYTTMLEQDLAVNRMRTAQYLYPEEQLFKTIPVYVRENLARSGNFSIGDIVPNITIHKDDTTQINLYDTFSKTQSNLMLCSSHT